MWTVHVVSVWDGKGTGILGALRYKVVQWTTKPRDKLWLTQALLLSEQETAASWAEVIPALRSESAQLQIRSCFCFVVALANLQAHRVALKKLKDSNAELRQQIRLRDAAVSRRLRRSLGKRS